MNTDKYSLNTHVAEFETSTYIADFRDSSKFIKYCQSCPNYQTSWACPPFDYDPLIRMHHYEYTYVIGTQVIFKEEFIQASEQQDIDVLSKNIMKEVRAFIDPRLLSIEQSNAPSLTFYAGNCHICDGLECARNKNRSCRFSNLIRPSLEAYGFDLQRSIEAVGLSLKWGENGKLPPYFILVSGLMTNLKISDFESYFKKHFSPRPNQLLTK